MLGKVPTVPDRYKRDCLITMDYERRNGDVRKCVANVGLGHHFRDRARHCGRRSPVARKIPPCSERFVAADGWCDDLECVEPLLDRVGFEAD